MVSTIRFAVIRRLGTVLLEVVPVGEILVRFFVGGAIDGLGLPTRQEDCTIASHLQINSEFTLIAGEEPTELAQIIAICDEIHATEVE